METNSTPQPELFLRDKKTGRLVFTRVPSKLWACLQAKLHDGATASPRKWKIRRLVGKAIGPIL